MTATPEIPGYQLTGIIGEGGFAMVYHAWQVAVGREVAVKIDNRILLNVRDQRRFVREVTAAGRLSGHPHVIDIYDAGMVSDGRPYMVMEFCPGGSLADAVHRHGAMNPAQVRDTGMKIADALAAAHAANVLHRDVKPANILLNRYGLVGLADFGLASVRAPGGDQSVSRETLTPAYASPEQFRGQEPTVAGDVYSLAATLYCLLAGRPPRFPADGRQPSIATIMSLHGTPIADIPGVPAALMATLRRGLADDPAMRPHSAAEFRHALAAAPASPAEIKPGIAAVVGSPVQAEPRTSAVAGSSAQARSGTAAVAGSPAQARSGTSALAGFPAQARPGSSAVAGSPVQARPGTSAVAGFPAQAEPGIVAVAGSSAQVRGSSAVVGSPVQGRPGSATVVGSPADRAAGAATARHAQPAVAGVSVRRGRGRHSRGAVRADGTTGRRRPKVRLATFASAAAAVIIAAAGFLLVRVLPPGAHAAQPPRAPATQPAGVQTTQSTGAQGLSAPARDLISRLDDLKNFPVCDLAARLAVGADATLTCETNQPGITMTVSSFHVTGPAIPFSPDLIADESSGLNAFLNTTVASSLPPIPVGSDADIAVPCAAQENTTCPYIGYSGFWGNPQQPVTYGRLYFYAKSGAYHIVWTFDNDEYENLHNDDFVVVASCADPASLLSWWRTTSGL